MWSNSDCCDSSPRAGGLVPPSHGGCNASPKPSLQALDLHLNGPKGFSLCAPLLLGAELALITILLIALNSTALPLSIGDVWPWLLLKRGTCLESLIKSAGRHLPIFIHNIFILIYWQHLEELASMQHQLDFIKIIRELS